MHDMLLAHQDALAPPDLLRYASQLGLNVERFRAHLGAHAGGARVASDVEGADLSGVSGTPTFFVMAGGTKVPMTSRRCRRRYGRRRRA